MKKTINLSALCWLHCTSTRCADLVFKSKKWWKQKNSFCFYSSFFHKFIFSSDTITRLGFAAIFFSFGDNDTALGLFILFCETLHSVDCWMGDKTNRKHNVPSVDVTSRIHDLISVFCSFGNCWFVLVAAAYTIFALLVANGLCVSLFHFSGFATNGMNHLTI